MFADQQDNHLDALVQKIINEHASFISDDDQINTSQKIDNLMASSMTLAYLGFNVFNLFLGLQAASLFNPGVIADEKTIDSLAYTWNDYDSVGGFVASYNLIKQGNWELGIANFLNSTQLTITTSIANIAKYSHLFSLTVQATTALTGFSFAASMAVNSLIELMAIAQSKKRIAQYEMLLTNDTISSENKNIIQQVIYIEKAKCENHFRSLKAWMVCTVAMFAVATVAYVAASVCSGGILPIITLVVASIAILSGFLRVNWLHRKNHLNEVKQSLKKSNDESLVTRLEKIINDPPAKYKYLFADNFYMPSFLQFYKKTYVCYLKELIVKDAKKLEKILNKLNGENVDVAIPEKPSSPEVKSFLGATSSQKVKYAQEVKSSPGETSSLGALSSQGVVSSPGTISSQRVTSPKKVIYSPQESSEGYEDYDYLVRRGLA